MITVRSVQKEGINSIELSNVSNGFSAKIDLNLGGSLQELKLKGKQIIANLHPKPYYNTYSSALLFPFANRIEGGTYKFKSKTYQFNCNEPNNNNALHGIIYNKVFQFIKKEITNLKTSVTLEYNETARDKAFPYTYCIQLVYTFSTEGLHLEMIVKNTDTVSFPFTIGWHPYFYTNNLEDSSIQFKAQKKIIHNECMIAIDAQDSNLDKICLSKNANLDDCFLLKAGNVMLKTPKYNLNITTNLAKTYLQIYTPPNINAVAIELVSGISNSFNNKEGLQILSSDKIYAVNWQISYGEE